MGEYGKRRGVPPSEGQRQRYEPISEICPAPWLTPAHIVMPRSDHVRQFGPPAQKLSPEGQHPLICGESVRVLVGQFFRKRTRLNSDTRRPKVEVVAHAQKSSG